MDGISGQGNGQTTAYKSSFRAEVMRFAERFAAADERAKRATTIKDREAAEWERLEAAGDFFAAERDIADLFLMMIRLALRHEPEAACMYLADLLRPELDALAQAIARLEARHDRL